MPQSELVRVPAPSDISATQSQPTDENTSAPVCSVLSDEDAWNSISGTAEISEVAQVRNGIPTCQHSTRFKTESYAVVDEWRDKIVEWSDMNISVDAFASRLNARFERY